MPFDTFAKVLRCPVYTNPYLGYTLKSGIGNPLNSYSTENKLDLFLDKCQNGSVELKVSYKLQR